MQREDHSFLYRFRLPFKLVGLLLLIGGILTGAFFLTKLGPQSVDPDEVYAEFDEAEGERLLALSEEKEQYFRKRAEQRPPTEEDYAVLDEAMDALQQYIDLAGGFHAKSARKRTELRAMRDEYRGLAIYEESSQLEVESARLMEAGDGQKSLLTLKRSARLQETINELYPNASRADTRRLTRLLREIDKLEAQPIYEESVAAQTEADAMVEAENFARARLLLQKAISLQKQLNMEYRGLQYADIQRLSKLEEQLASLESSDLYDEIKASLDVGAAAEQDKRYAEAAESYQNAFRLQKQLNRDFPQSRFAAGRKLEDYRALRENALSRDLGDDINADLARLDAMLRERKVWQAVELLHALEPKVDSFAEQFPRSTVLPPKAALKLQYLSAVESDLGFLQDRIYGQLLPVEGIDGWHLLRTEVPQALYMSVMLDANPSRNKGELLPVDSGNWDEAQAFAERVSWLLGRPARLPKEAEYRAALGSLRYVVIDDVAWSLGNSDGMTREIATREPTAQGFYDLLGNVAEWLQGESVPGDGEGILAGGSVESSADVLAEVPMQYINQRTRNRFAGFRIAVDLSE